MTRSILGTVVVALSLIFVLLLVVPVASAQEAASVDRFALARSLGKHEASFGQRVALVAQGGPAMVPELLDEIAAGRSDRMTVTALGYLATADNDSVLDVLDGLAFGGDPAAPRLAAVEALLRLGGPGVERVTTALAKPGMQPIPAAEILEVLWQVPDRADLRRALSALEALARNHPDSRIRTLAAEYGVPRLETALAIRLAPESEGARRLLEEVLADQQPAFAVLAGGRAELWAAEGLARWHGSAAAPALQNFLRAQPNLPAGTQKQVLSALAQIEDSLTEGQRKTLADLATLDATPLTVDRTLADLPAPPAVEELVP
ncbi:MAG: hypothetical protein AAF481_01905 [Acidobacteriota bacterium]